ncbi:MAG: hypothetical protein QXW23_03445 [Thermofilaceae archaeon]
MPSAEITNPSLIVFKLLHVPQTHPLYTTAMRMFQKDAIIKEWEKALFTGRIIAITDPEIVERSALSGVQSEEEGRKIIKKLLEGLRLSISERKAEEDLLEVLKHEYCHWYILRETSVVTLLDAVSWMIRMLQIYLTEIFHIRTGFERELKKQLEVNEALKRLSEVEKGIDAIVKDDINLKIFRYLIHYILFLYTVLLKSIIIVVEPVTWAIMGYNQEDCMRLLMEYFSDDVRRELAERVLKRSLELIENGIDVFRLMKLSRQSLDVPLKYLNDYIENGYIEVDKEKYADLAVYFYDRFMRITSEAHCEIETSKECDKNPATVWSNIFSSRSDVNKAIVDLVGSILAEEPEVLKYLAERAALVSTFEEPTIFIINPKDYNFIRYDPLAGLTESASVINVYVRRTKRLFNTFEDIVGDLPLTHRGFILSLHAKLIFNDVDSVTRTFRLHERRLGEKFYEKILDEAIALGGWDRDKLIRLYRETDSFTFKDYLISWAYLVLRLGEKAGLLSGLHGAW